MMRTAALLAIALASLAGCHAPRELSEMRASPDGRFIAIAEAAGDLAVIDRERPGALPIYTTHYGGGLAWSRDSRRLVYLEREPGQAPQLWGALSEIGGEKEPLAAGKDWKAAPGWIDSARVVYLSDDRSNHVNVMEIDTRTRETRALLDVGADIEGLWVSPVAGEFIYRTSVTGTPELWLWWGRENPPLRLTRDPTGDWALEEKIAFAPSGRAMAFVARYLDQVQVVLYDLGARRVRHRVVVPAEPGSLAIGPRDEVVIAMGGGLYIWRPDRRWGAKLSDRLDWSGVDLTRPQWIGESGWAAIGGGGLVITARRLDRLSDPVVHARDSEDLMHLAGRFQRAGQGATARAILDDLARGRAGGGESGAALDAVRAWTERLNGRERAADRRLAEALEQVRGEPALTGAIWRERLLVQLFEAGKASGAAGLLEAMTPRAAEDPLVAWVDRLLRSDDARALELWGDAGREVRRGRWDRAAQAILRVTESDARSPLNRQGLALLLRGEFEPLARVLLSEPEPMEALYGHPAFQAAMLRVAGGDLTEDFGRAELRGRLLLRWTRGERWDAARDLVRIDMRDREGPTFDYLDMLDRYLDADEQERWMERAVGDVLLDDEIAPLLAVRMRGRRESLVFNLARAKRALIRGDDEALEAALRDLDAARGARDAASDPDLTRLTFLRELYWTKRHERRQQWELARAGYASCAAIVAGAPGDWGVVAFDLEWARSLIEAGSHDPDLLRALTQIVRGLGDPLVNPAHEPGTLRTGLANIRTVASYAPDPWARPYLDYLEGIVMGQMDRPYQALAALRRAGRGRPAGALTGRALFERAAVRGSLGQDRLAADRLAELCDLRPPTPQLAAAISARVQAEVEYGGAESTQARLRQLCRELNLDADWTAALTGF